MWVTDIVLLVGGLVILGCGGECLVRGAAQLARQLGVSALVVGLTIVAFGTSAPEIAVSMQSAAQGQPDLAVGNVVGSCIMNILIVLGIAALVRPLRVSRNVVTMDALVMLMVTGVFMLFAVDKTIDRWQGLLFVVGLALYTVVTYYEARFQPKVVEDEYEHDPRQEKTSLWVSVPAVVVGLAGLVKGADLIVEGGLGIAELLGVSKRIIGLTLFAFGTSLPEMAICVIAARRSQPDIAIGNVVGSNIFNILAVIGITAAFFPLGVNDKIFRFDAPVMLGVVVLSFWVLRTGHRISRREGALLLGLYAVYLGVMLCWR